MIPEETQALVESALDGDRGAFSRLVEEHRRLAAGVAFGIVGDVHLAADAVQDAFFKAYQGLNQLKDPQRFVPWFLSIVRSCTTDLLRRQMRVGGREIPIGDGLAIGLPVGGSVSGARESVSLRWHATVAAWRLNPVLAAATRPPFGSIKSRELLILSHIWASGYQAGPCRGELAARSAKFKGKWGG